MNKLEPLSPMRVEDIERESFIMSFKRIQHACWRTAVEKGWYDKDRRLNAVEMADDLREYIQHLKNGTRVALMHSELSEGLEGERKTLMDDKIPEFKMIEAELADTIIRAMDFAEENNLRLAEAIIAKANFNKTREYRHGNKAF